MVVVAVSFLVQQSPDVSGLRGAAQNALQGIAVLFAINAAMAMALYTNYVSGLRSRYIQQVSRVKEVLESFLDEYCTQNDDDAQEIIEELIYPMLSAGENAWWQFDEVNEMRKNCNDAMIRLHEKDVRALPRYLVKVEGEMNELGLLYIQRVTSTLNFQVLGNTIWILAFGMLVIAFGHIIPKGNIADSFVVLTCIAAITFSILGVFHSFSFLAQEAREESGESDW